MIKIYVLIFCPNEHDQDDFVILKAFDNKEIAEKQIKDLSDYYELREIDLWQYRD